jgi:hypothetical protein
MVLPAAKYTCVALCTKFDEQVMPARSVSAPALGMFSDRRRTLPFGLVEQSAIPPRVLQ